MEESGVLRVTGAVAGAVGAAAGAVSSSSGGVYSIVRYVSLIES